MPFVWPTEASMASKLHDTSFEITVDGKIGRRKYLSILGILALTNAQESLGEGSQGRPQTGFLIKVPKTCISFHSKLPCQGLALRAEKGDLS